jgi:hypothetical protein
MSSNTLCRVRNRKFASFARALRVRLRRGLGVGGRDELSQHRFDFAPLDVREHRAAEVGRQHRALRGAAHLWKVRVIKQSV